MALPASSGAMRMDAARRRARSAKIGLTAVGVGFFALGMTLAHGTVSGHTRRQARPLAAPKRFQDAVRRDALGAGLLAPAQAPPGATTSVS
ncbi:MAG TPA: hypothetical protein VHI30_04155 [Gaiellales bacterium]|nr:hypothetical protein [Gaiellales bacterium]